MSRGPNILLTGTPGVGKSSLAQLLVEREPSLRLLDVNAVVKAEGFHEGRDEVHHSYGS